MAAGIVGATLDSVFAEQSARIVSSIVRATGDWELAEDSLQDAAARAIAAWETDGVPDNPGAWLTTVAKRRAIDQLRRASSERRAVGALARENQSVGTEEQAMMIENDPVDDRLSLIFTCAHPALSMDARVALTLRTVAGLSVTSIARSFMVSDATMTKRLVRARARIKDAGIPYRVPPPELLAERASGVLAVLYLLFNEGYSATGGHGLVDAPLQREATRLARLLIDVAGAAPYREEAVGLLAMMLLHGSRNRARLGAAGEVIPLEDQDRSLWDHDAIAEAVGLLNEATLALAASGGSPGPYYLQASIAVRHAVADSPADTDFVGIAALYRTLMAVAPSPVVELNLAVAIAMADGPGVALALVERLDDSGVLEGYYLVPAARADLLRRLGRSSDALPHYARAAALAPSGQERAYLTARIAAAAAPETFRR